MPRASTYLVAGFTYHLTHRCHDRSYLLRTIRERNRYREWLREGIRRFRVSVFGYCITHNHVHVIAHADDRERISALMHLAAGATAKQYNLRKGRLGAMWEHPFHCTKIEDGRHLFNCLCYVDLNMVRAGKIEHPRDWKWCSYDELAGIRQRYRIVDQERLAEKLEFSSVQVLRDRYLEALDERMRSRQIVREPQWTESVAVGSKAFIMRAQAASDHRTRYELSEVGTGATGVWCLKETPVAYT